MKIFTVVSMEQGLLLEVYKSFFTIKKAKRWVEDIHEFDFPDKWKYFHIGDIDDDLDHSTYEYWEHGGLRILVSELVEGQ